MHDVPDAYQWLVWDYYLIASSFLTSVLFYLALPYRKRNLKIAAVVMIVLNIWIFTDYTMAWKMEGYAYLELFRSILTMLFAAAFTSYAVTATHEILTSKSNQYTESKSFIVNKIPKNLAGLIGSIFKNPKGLTFVVVNGQEYRFSHGKVVSRSHKSSQRYTYKWIRDINDIELDRISKLKWSLRGNCFTVFKRYDKEPRLT